VSRSHDVFVRRELYFVRSGCIFDLDKKRQQHSQRYKNIKRLRRAGNLFSISNSTLCDDEQQPQQAAINDWGLKSPSRNYRLFSSRAPPGANFALK
jgi:hypothetical protein